MNGPLKISEATSLALHSLALLADGQGRNFSVKELAGRLAASEAHLSKILQRMNKMGLVNSTRGPGGGFDLAQPPERIRLIDVYEEFEGPVNVSGCLLDHNVCTGGACLLGGILGDISKQFVTYLKQTSLSEIDGGIGGCIHD
jgi:Rrf2 family transcriptional regulator, nitric oxide-sensitive transcriptional repressor